MKRIALEAQTREISKKSALKGLRIKGLVPAILYGKDQEAIPISVVLKEVDSAVGGKSGFNVLFDLKLAGKDPVIARIREYQADPIQRQFTHIDFQKIDIKEKMVVEVAVETFGESPGVKEGGVLTLQRRVLELRCLPTNVPSSIKVDISNLNIGDNVHISQITLPEDVELAHKEADFAVLNISAPMKEEVVTPAVPVEGEEGAAVPAEGAEAAAAAGQAPAEGKSEAKDAKKPEAKDAKKAEAKDSKKADKAKE